MKLTNTLPPIDEILPHRGTMLLLDRMIESKTDSAIAEYAPRPDAWYADSQGDTPAWIGIEMMAQTVAAHVGMSKRQAGLPPKQGVLLGTRRYTSSVSRFIANKPLRIYVNMVYSDASGLGAYECHIRSDDDELASATLKLFEPGDFDSFLKGEFHE
jgi:predicted hotdog family 3-hydroxylacyl-ACP dehydratase